jgi:hypothetical protein
MELGLVGLHPVGPLTAVLVAFAAILLSIGLILLRVVRSLPKLEKVSSQPTPVASAVLAVLLPSII